MTDSATTAAQHDLMAKGDGFIAALDQSGGSTPKALKLYGVEPDSYSGDEEMFAKMHEMRSRIMLADDFTNSKVVGAILFERTMDAEVAGKPTPAFLWEDRGIIPFLKVDKGLEDEANGVQLMKDMPGLDALLDRAKAAGVYGTKMRSVVQSADAAGIAAIVDQQFEIGKQIIAHGLVPILEPEVNIHSNTKVECEAFLKDEILKHLDTLDDDQNVMLKLTIPSAPNHYQELSDHPRVIKVVALSGGYSTDQACVLLKQNTDMIASFSRALTEGLNVDMSDAEFNAALGSNIEKIYQASV